MKKDDAYPPRFFSAATFGAKPRVFTIECVRKEQFENDGQTVTKPAVYFKGERSGVVPPVPDARRSCAIIVRTLEQSLCRWWSPCKVTEFLLAETKPSKSVH